MIHENFDVSRYLEVFGSSSVAEYVISTVASFWKPEGTELPVSVDEKLALLNELTSGVPVDFDSMASNFFGDTESVDDVSIYARDEGVDGIVLVKAFESRGLIEGRSQGFTVRYGKSFDQSESWIIVSSQHQVNGYRALLAFWDNYITLEVVDDLKEERKQKVFKLTQDQWVEVEG